MFLPKSSSKKGKSNKDKLDINQKVIQLIREAVRNDPTKEMISFLGDEMEKSREHELKLFQLMLGNRANSGMPPSPSMDTGFYPSMPSSLGSLRKGCLKVLMGTLSFMVMGNTKHCKLCRTESIFIYTSITVLPT